MKTLKNTLENNYTNYVENYSPELPVSKVAEKIPLTTKDNILFNLLVEAVAIIPYN